MLINSSPTSLGQPCGLNCLNKGKCAVHFTIGDIMQAHEFSYGTTLFDEKLQKWNTTVKSREASKRWREKQQSFLACDTDGKAIFKYVVAGRDVCEDYARLAYGIPLGTWGQNQSLLRKPGKMAMHVEMREWDQATAQALKSEQTSSTSEAVQWWLMMFPLWDAIPAESIIKHPRLIWDQLYVSTITPLPICSDTLITQI
eukprot:6212759-Pleurochrysis_carterae.AAC.6